MPINPEPIVRCSKCGAHIADIEVKWIAEYEAKHKGRSEILMKGSASPWSFIRNKILDTWREFGALKGWMTQGQCPEKECDGRWWDSGQERLSVAVPHHFKEAKEDERRRRSELRDGEGDARRVLVHDEQAGQRHMAPGESNSITNPSA